MYRALSHKLHHISIHISKLKRCSPQSAACTVRLRELPVLLQGCVRVPGSPHTLAILNKARLAHGAELFNEPWLTHGQTKQPWSWCEGSDSTSPQIPSAATACELGNTCGSLKQRILRRANTNGTEACLKPTCTRPQALCGLLS